ncbi:MAG TPA: hypothetical protein VJR95_06055 [Rhodanobacter sp.]|nr:hypothetical protein [Rhodanobacter sp.]
MNTKLFWASLFLVAIDTAGRAPAAVAGEVQSLPQAQAVQHVFDCKAKRTLPSQREVGEWAGQHSFAQVYDTRQKLMAAVGRACLKAGIKQVRLVRDRPDGSGHVGREVARAEASNR